MNDFGTQLTALLDDAAAGIEPRPDFDAVRDATVPVVSNTASGSRRFRGAVGVAAATVALLGAGVAAYQVVDGEPTSVMTSSDDTAEPVEPVVKADASGAAQRPERPRAVVPVERREPDSEAEATDAVDVERTAELGSLVLEGSTLVQSVHGVAAPGEAVRVASEFGPTAVGVADGRKWELSIRLSNVPPGESAPIRVTFGGSVVVYEFEVRHPKQASDTAEPPKAEPPKEEPPKAEPPKEEPPKEEPPKEEPPVVAFTTRLGSSSDDATRMKQVFFGTAPAGAVITASSEWGAADTTAGPKGEWEMRLILEGVPDDTVVHVTVRSNTSDATFEYDLVRAVPAGESVVFTSNLGGGDLGGAPMKQVLFGTGNPGSVVVAATGYGSADAVVGPKGQWEMALKMYEVPAGATVGVRVTNNASASVFEYGLRRPAGEPAPIGFTAQAAFVECDSTPPFNEYWGTAPAGATISITSPYGGKQVTANGDGNWEARIEFPSAPLGETFFVRLASSSGGPAKELPFKRVEPV
jgi:hypothetical protein